MGAEQGKKVIMKSEGEYAKLQGNLQAASGAGSAATDDEALDEKRHDRGYNPIDDAERGSVSEKLNSDASRYRKGPGPM